MADGDIATGYFRLVPTTDGVESAIANQFSGAGKTAATGFSRSFVPALGGLLAVAGGVALAREIGTFVSEGISAVNRWETINAQTAAAIKSTGGVANVSADQVNKLAESIEATTATEAEAIQEGANLLLTFKNIRNEAGAGNDIFDQTTRAMVDVSRAMGTDASGSAIQLGKALNDPIKGIAALARVGITFTAEQKELITSLVESGDLLGAQKIILEELNSQFGGSGAAYASTLAGQNFLLADSYGDLQESIASGITPALKTFSGLATDVLTRIGESTALQTLIANLNTGANGVAENAQIVLGIVDKLNATPSGFTLAGFVSELESAFPALGPILDVLNSLAPILPALADAFVEIGPDVALLLPPLTDLVLQLLPLLVTLVPIVTGAISLAAPVVSGLATNFDALFTAVDSVAGFFAGDTSFVDMALEVEGLGTSMGGTLEQSQNFGREIGPIFNGVSLPVASFGLTVASMSLGVGTSFLSATVSAARFSGEVRTNIERAIGEIAAMPGRGVAALGQVGALLVRSGRSLIQGFIDGVNEKVEDVRRAIGRVTEIAAGFFPNSPAKYGAFSGSGWTAIREAGQAIIDQFQSGIPADALAISGGFTAVPLTSSSWGSVDSVGSGIVPMGAIAPRPTEGASGGDQYVTQNIQLNEEEPILVARKFSRELKAVMR